MASREGTEDVVYDLPALMTTAAIDGLALVYMFDQIQVNCSPKFPFASLQSLCPVQETREQRCYPLPNISPDASHHPSQQSAEVPPERKRQAPVPEAREPPKLSNFKLSCSLAPKHPPPPPLHSEDTDRYRNHVPPPRRAGAEQARCGVSAPIGDEVFCCEREKM